MISVLIPVFNCTVTSLVLELQKQLSLTGLQYEIVVMDDGSDVSFKKDNRILEGYQQVKYTELPYNIGRISIRNELFKKAAFNWLLFLDADSIIITSNFIKTYLNTTNVNANVIVGGRVYDKEKPASCCLRLHWTYGSQREQQLPEQRQKQPHAGFMSNNFLIKKEIFEKLHITEALQGYGHEDTWMGIQLENIGAKVLHIANPVMHNGLEDSQVFVEKSLNGLQNLLKLQQIVGAETLKRHVKLYAAYCRYRRWGLLPLLNIGFVTMQPLILKKQHSCHPSLFLFDLYRLNYFACLNKTVH